MGNPGDFGDIYLYMKDLGEIIRIAEGNGSNLSQKDEDNGYVDYFYYETFKIDCGISEHDGGMILRDKYIQEEFKCLTDCIPIVLEFAYGSANLEYTELN